MCTCNQGVVDQAKPGRCARCGRVRRGARCETGETTARLMMQTAERVASAIMPALPPGFGISFALHHAATGNVVVSALPAATPEEIAEAFEEVLSTLRTGVHAAGSTVLYERKTGRAVRRRDDDGEAH